MSYGSESATAASNAGSAASNAGTAATTASTMGEGASAVGAAGESGMYVNGIGQTQPGGFTLGMEEGAMNTGTGPTVAQANIQDYGTADPSWFDKTAKFLDEYQKGKEQNIGQAWKNKGFNAQTAGYVGGKMEGMMKGGGGGTQAPPVTLNNTYQQPENEYLRRYMMARRR
jgi:hypothetical protein